MRVGFKTSDDQPTLAERIRERLIDRVGSDEESALVAAVMSVQANLRGKDSGTSCGRIPQAAL